MRDQVQEVKEKTDIVALIGESVTLKQAGRHWKGLCPFHNEKSPSFIVSPDIGLYKCFGCGESGDVFTYLEKHEGMDFVEALKYLAKRLNIEIIDRNFIKSDERDELYMVNEQAALFYSYILTKHEKGSLILKYLKEKRGLSLNTIETFRLGASPLDKNLLFNHFTQKKKIKPSVLEKAGLVIRSKYGYLDRFYGRAIFPISDHQGRVVALAGRILPEWDSGKSGKYINSPETLIYHKSNSLYGLNITKHDISKTKLAVVVEGEVDAISAWQNGVKNVVAIKGSAFTEGQLTILSRFAKEITLALDSDFAGNNAAIKGVNLAQKSNFIVKVAQLGEYKDPDEFARANPSGFVQAIKDAVDVWDFIIEFYLAKYDISSGSGAARVSQTLLPLISDVTDPVSQSRYLQYLAMRLRVPVESLSQQMIKISKSAGATNAVGNTSQIESLDRRTLLERNLLGFALVANNVKSVVDYIKSSPFVRIIDLWNKFKKEDGIHDLQNFVQSLPDDLREIATNLIMSVHDESSDDMKEIINEIEIMTVREELSDLSGKIAQYEHMNDVAKLSAALKAHSDLSRKLIKLTNST